jgi:ParB family chromosome partitioning protein
MSEFSKYDIELVTLMSQLSQSSDSRTIKQINKIKEKGSDKIKEDFLEGRISLPEAYKKVTVHVSNNSGKYEWYTPSKFVDAARNTMGSIDLDPASSDIANIIVHATKYFTKEDNGLIRPWFGNVWMNPPYNNSLVVEFTEKLIKELPNIEQACVLVNNATETRWFQKILNHSDAICFVKGRIKFLDVNGETTGSSLQGQVIMYFGIDVEKFDENFRSFGTCMTRM